MCYRLLLLVLLPVSLLAQLPNTAPAAAPLDVFVHTEANSVRFYWWIQDAASFGKWHEKGYQVERRDRTIAGVGEWQTINDGPITVSSPQAFQASDYPYADQVSKFAFEPDGSRVSYQNPGVEGEELIQFINSREEVMFFIGLGTMSSWDMARAFGLGFEDDSAKPGLVYEYRISPLAEPSAATSVLVRTGQSTIYPHVSAVEADWQDKLVKISWDSQTDAYYGYQVFRRVKGTETWQDLPNGRLLNLMRLNTKTEFTDTLQSNDITYEYAIQGMGRLGFNGPLGVNLVGQGTAIELPPIPLISVDDNGDGRFIVSWTFPTEANPAIIDYFTVHRGLQPTGGLSLVSPALPGDSQVFYDSIVADQIWYTVTAHTNEGAKVPSVRQHGIADDTIPPPPVTGLRGEIDREGFVTVTWDPSPATDAIGYRVWYSNSGERAGTRKTDTLEVINLFVDSLDLTAVNDTVFYRVSALDERENVSEWSEPLALPIPDILPPAPPRLRTFSADTNGILFTYAPSSSEDVVRYELQRRARYTDYWQTFGILPPTTTVSEFRDSTGADNITYEYRMVAFDEQGLRGPSNVFVAKRQMRHLYPAIEELTVTAQRSQLSILLGWVYPENDLIESFRIYRGNASGQLEIYRTIAADELDRRRAKRPGQPAQWRFTDEEISRDTQYAYSVRAIYRTGAESRIGQTVSVAF